MTLLHIEGFEGQEGAGTFDGVSGFGSIAASSSTRFSSGYALLGDHYSGRKDFTASATVVVGFAFKLSANSGEPIFYLYGDSGATQHVIIYAGGSNSIVATRAGTTLGTSASGVFTPGSWAYMEVKATLSDTVGAIEIRMNGNPTPIISLTNVDTKNGGTASTFDALYLNFPNSASIAFDDLYILNTSGSVNNNFLGDVRVQTLFPTGAGSSTGLTPSTGSNWQCVDEAPPSATDYVGSNVTGTRDTYSIGDLVAGTASVLGVVVRSHMHKSDAGSSSMKAALRSGGTNYYGTTRALSTSMTRYSDLFETDPATSAAWTVSAVNAVEIGAEVA